MVALVALILILAIFGGLGFAVHVLWYVLIAAVLLWLIGFFVGGVADGGGGRRWYGALVARCDPRCASLPDVCCL
jgi:hypothetical protein